jgi:hypothetical protein
MTEDLARISASIDFLIFLLVIMAILTGAAIFLTHRMERRIDRMLTTLRRM